MPISCRGASEQWTLAADHCPPIYGLGGVKSRSQEATMPVVKMHRSVVRDAPIGSRETSGAGCRTEEGTARSEDALFPSLQPYLGSDSERHQGIVPNHHFAAASSECVNLFRDRY